MKFLADEMCGNIARWMRILGFDVIYSKDYEKKLKKAVDDKFLVEEALKDYRILISKDKKLIDSFKQKINLKINEKTELSHKFLENFYKPYENIYINNSQVILPAYFIEGTNILEIIINLFKYFKISIKEKLNFNPEFTRCTKCNAELELIENKEKYKNLIPERVYNFHNEFWICKNEECKKIYWRGRHFERIEKFIQELYQNLM